MPDVTPVLRTHAKYDRLIEAASKHPAIATAVAHPCDAVSLESAIEAARLQHKHTFLGVIPLFHAFGMTAMMLAPIQLGAPVIYMARFSAPGAANGRAATLATARVSVGLFASATSASW